MDSRPVEPCFPGGEEPGPSQSDRHVAVVDRHDHSGVGIVEPLGEGVWNVVTPVEGVPGERGDGFVVGRSRRSDDHGR